MNTDTACCTPVEAELKADLYWRFGRSLPPPILQLMFASLRRQLRERLSAQEFAAFTGSTARALCRAHIERLIADFLAWTPLADACSGVTPRLQLQGA
jgi:hypothetical protein